MDMKKTMGSNGKVLGLALMCVTSILLLLLSIQVIFQLTVLLYPALMSVKVRKIRFEWGGRIKKLGVSGFILTPDVF